MPDGRSVTPAAGNNRTLLEKGPVYAPCGAPMLLDPNGPSGANLDELSAV